MIEIEGIKDFIENNKESLEKMNQEMIASRGHVPLVWLTVDEAKALLFMSGIFSIEHYTPDQNKELLNNLYRQLLRQDFESTKKYFECFRKNEQFRNEWKRIEQMEMSKQST